jgi:hypothetical protein
LKWFFFLFSDFLFPVFSQAALRIRAKQRKTNLCDSGKQFEVVAMQRAKNGEIAAIKRADAGDT